MKFSAFKAFAAVLLAIMFAGSALAADAKCGADKKGEMKCGAAKCGADKKGELKKKKPDAKCDADKKCGADKK
ncbi:MAG: HvfA family oxazolone/thioamide-modified RiPP metallophore [Wolinella sp.]